MKRMAMLAALSIVVSGSALAGIAMGTPLVSGDVATLADRHETSRKELSQGQLQELSRWLAQHKSGWHGMITEASSEPISLAFSLKDAAGEAGSIAVVMRSDGGHYLQFNSSSQTWTYRSFGGLVKSWAAMRELSAAELDELLQVAGN